MTHFQHWKAFHERQAAKRAAALREAIGSAIATLPCAIIGVLAWKVAMLPGISTGQTLVMLLACWVSAILAAYFIVKSVENWRVYRSG